MSQFVTSSTISYSLQLRLRYHNYTKLAHNIINTRYAITSLILFYFFILKINLKCTCAVKMIGKIKNTSYLLFYYSVEIRTQSHWCGISCEFLIWFMTWQVRDFNFSPQFSGISGGSLSLPDAFFLLTFLTTKSSSSSE